MKRVFITTALTLTLGSTFHAGAQGVPVIDGAAIAQMVQQLAQMQQEYELLKQQYATQQQQLAAEVGSYGRGSIGLDDALSASNIVPGSWQDVVNQQASGAYGSKVQDVEKLINTMPADVFADPTGQSATNYRMSTDSVRAAMAGGDVLYAEVQTHLDNLAKLAAQVDRTANVKDAQDLQNRIAIENGMLQATMAKLTIMNSNLQANMLNEQNQGTATNEKRFGKHQ